MPLFPSDWTEAFTQQGAGETAEYVPAGQTAENWEDKIVLEVYYDLNSLPLDALERRALAQTKDSCDGVVEGRFQSGLNNGYASAFWTMGCKRQRQSGQGETRYTKAIQGKTTLYVLTRTWRTPPFGDAGPKIPQRTIEDAMAFLTSAVVCMDGSADHPCPAAKQSKP